jgi:serine/threonine protein kinase
MPLEKLGPYKIERLLGRGGMGAVYAGVKEATGERAAIKLLSGHLADDETFRERFKQEIETLKRLLHPHIVQLHGYGEEDGKLYYVMELVEGRCLQDELTAGRRFNWREVARLGIAISQALKHAHDRGIIHRDLKPANLLIDPQDHIKLTDFGIAKLYGGSSVTAEGGVLGTADYMAPEQADGKPVTSRCDLYALGSVLYALLTGKPPFVGKSLVEVVTALQRDQPVPVRRLAPDTPAEFEQIILQLLEKDPNKRIPTALALGNRLKAMEHALSLDTRIMRQGDLASDPGAVLPDDALPSSAKTELVNPASSPTAPLPSASDEEYRLANDPTLVTGAGSHATPSSRTALGTQAGKRTGAGSGGGTHAERSGTEAPADPPAKLTRFTTVSEDDLRGSRLSDDAPLKQWGVAAALAAVGLIVVALAVYGATRPPSADRLYATAKAAVERGGPETLIPVEAELTRFLQLYPADPRASEVQEYADELERYRLERRLGMRNRRPPPGQSPTPIERAYQEASQLASTDPLAALERFEALVAVYDSPPDPAVSEAEQRKTEQCLALARKQVDHLRPEVERLIAEQQMAVRRQLDRADELAATDRGAAMKVWQGVITLYRGKAWANELVAQAEAKLAASGVPSANGEH